MKRSRARRTDERSVSMADLSNLGLPCRARSSETKVTGRLPNGMIGHNATPRASTSRCSYDAVHYDCIR